MFLKYLHQFDKLEALWLLRKKKKEQEIKEFALILSPLRIATDIKTRLDFTGLLYKRGQVD